LEAGFASHTGVCPEEVCHDCAVVGRGELIVQVIVSLFSMFFLLEIIFIFPLAFLESDGLVSV
jgi:hypothetical protein